VKKIWQAGRSFDPLMGKDERYALYAGWQKAIKRVFNWDKDS
jgi:glycerol kinase